MPLSQVTYPGHEFAGQPLTVEILSPERARELAAPILGLVVAGYAHQYEGPGKPLESGAFARKYDNDGARERWRDEVVPGVYERGGAYYAVAEPHEPGKLAAVFKALPGEAIKARFADRRAGIAEVVVAPGHQGQGLAAATILTYFEHGGLQPEDRAMSEVINGSPMARWLWSLHFRREEPSDALRLDAHNALPSYYYVTEDYLEGPITVGGLAAEIIDRHPTLQVTKVSA